MSKETYLLTITKNGVVALEQEFNDLVSICIDMDWGFYEFLNISARIQDYNYCEIEHKGNRTKLRIERKESE